MDRKGLEKSMEQKAASLHPDIWAKQGKSEGVLL
jgi:hypothetical protein